jgi:heme-degrading monooxygenase HmoA
MARSVKPIPDTPNPLPDITRPDVGTVLSCEWTVGTPERQQAVVEASVTAWEHVPWPAGLLSHNGFVSTDGSTILHYSQWTSDEAIREFKRTDRPERVRGILAAVPGIERHGVVAYQLYRSYRNGAAAGAPRVPGCIVGVNIDFDGPDRQRQRRWVDAVFDALELEGEPHPGLISAHFHLSTDGTRVFNYAEWSSEQAYSEALSKGPEGIGQTDAPEWRRTMDFPGLKGFGVKRYHLHRSLTGPQQSNNP